MELDRSRSYGTFRGGVGAGHTQDGLLFTLGGKLFPGQDVPEEARVVIVKEEAPRQGPEPKYDDPGYAPENKPKVYITQMNLRQLRAECINLGVEYGPGDMKKALIVKIRAARR